MVVSCVNGKERSYTGSIPANSIVKSFLGIPLSDSIDFIRWKLTLSDNAYTLNCNYGIGKPNTNGFINGGKKIELTGTLKKEKNYYLMQNGNKTLKLAELNDNLLHLLNNDNTLMIGNGGWSYTLNNTVPLSTDKANATAQRTILKDSMAFEGRTPCRGLDSRPECFKLKWYIILYADAKTNRPTHFDIKGTAYRTTGSKADSWKIIVNKDGQIIYQLNIGEAKSPLYLLKLDENVLIFTDANGNLLVGDEDFSYTVNRKF